MGNARRKADSTRPRRRAVDAEDSETETIVCGWCGADKSSPCRSTVGESQGFCTDRE